MQTAMDDHKEQPLGPSKRRRKAKANAEKKYECKECGKTYSRAEHLYRHQLNRKKGNFLTTSEDTKFLYR